MPFFIFLQMNNTAYLFLLSLNHTGFPRSAELQVDPSFIMK